MPHATTKSRRRRVLQPLLMLGTVLTAVTVVAATLSPRPAIEAPQEGLAAYQQNDFQRTLASLNQQIDQMSADASLERAAPAESNMLVARRLSLALVGSGLSLEEYRALSAVPKDKQVEWWTSYLLEDRRWADYFSERLARAYVGTDFVNLILFRRRKFTTWLADQLENGTPYDEVVASMIDSEGIWTDNPEVNFITAAMPEERQTADPILLAGRTSRAFLAQRIDCVQCHDDFLGNLNFGTSEDRVDGIQEHFHTLAAFYGSTGIMDAPFQGIRDGEEPYKYQYLGADEEQDIEPAVPFYPDLLPQDGRPRARLAKWVTHEENLAFARATVNRVWALMFSRPLVTPVDNIPLHGEVPPALDTLAEDFAQHGFDMRRLIRLIATSDAFQRGSRAEFEVTEEHEESWAVFPLTQLRPEQVAGSVFQASNLKANDYSSSIFTQLRSFGDLQDFLKRYGDRGEDEFDSASVTIPQRLIMMNGNMVTERTKVDLVNNAATRIGALVQDDDQAIDLVYICALNREPTQAEKQVFLEHLQEKSRQSRQQAVGDILWALVNSTEFSWNH